MPVDKSFILWYNDYSKEKELNNMKLVWIVQHQTHEDYATEIDAIFSSRESAEIAVEEWTAEDRANGEFWEYEIRDFELQD